jgi:hypothetical protein
LEADVPNIRELADYLKMAEKIMYRFATENSISGFKVCCTWRLRKCELDKWIKEPDYYNKKSGKAVL